MRFKQVWGGVSSPRSADWRARDGRCATMPSAMAATSLSRIGVVVHPNRSIDHALDALRGWADEHGVGLAQVRVDGNDREVAEPTDAQDCDLVAAIGGDGTMLAAIRAAAGA